MEIVYENPELKAKVIARLICGDYKKIKQICKNIKQKVGGGL